MYYIVSDTGQIVEELARCDEESIQNLADYFGCAVYAIQGEHSGYSAEPAASAIEALEGR